jgi:cytochrome c oxidase subunit 4
MNEENAEHVHPDNKTYLFIAAILTAVTGIEFGCLYIPALAPIVAPLLLSLSAGKFVLVVGYYMHLKPDPSLFRWVFLVPLGLAAIVMLMLLGLMR